MVRQNPDPTRVGNQLSFVDLYSVTAVKSRRERDVRVKGPEIGCRKPIVPRQLPFCHFESVTDFTHGIFGTPNRLGFWDAKNSSGSFL
jgi:hypothetical protein